MFKDLIKLAQVVNSTFPVVDPEFKGNHSIILNKDGVPSLLVWYQRDEKSPVKAYQATLDEFEWDNLESEFRKMREKISEQETIANS